MVWSVTNHYEVNVAKDCGRKTYDGKILYEHWCAIILREDFESVALAKFNIIKESFPAPEFNCSLTLVQCSGTKIEEV